MTFTSSVTTPRLTALRSRAAPSTAGSSSARARRAGKRRSWWRKAPRRPGCRARLMKRTLWTGGAAAGRPSADAAAAGSSLPRSSRPSSVRPRASRRGKSWSSCISRLWALASLEPNWLRFFPGVSSSPGRCFFTDAGSSGANRTCQVPRAKLANTPLFAFNVALSPPHSWIDGPIEQAHPCTDEPVRCQGFRRRP